MPPPKKKWKGSCDSGRSYHNKWENDFPWVMKAPEDTKSAYSKLCRCTVKAKKDVLKGHEQTTKHQQNMNAINGTTPLLYRKADEGLNDILHHVHLQAEENIIEKEHVIESPSEVVTEGLADDNEETFIKFTPEAGYLSYEAVEVESVLEPEPVILDRREEESDFIENAVNVVPLENDLDDISRTSSKNNAKNFDTDVKENVLNEPSVALNVVVSDSATIDKSKEDLKKFEVNYIAEENSGKVVPPSNENKPKAETLSIQKQDTNLNLEVNKQNYESDKQNEQDHVKNETASEEIRVLESETESQQETKETSKDQTPSTEKLSQPVVTQEPDNSLPSEDKESDETEQPMKISSEENISTNEVANESSSETETLSGAAELTEKSNEKPVKLEDDDIQSFEEWKKNQIQSREEAASTETIGSTVRAIRTKKTQMNYASQDCGAKVLSHNPEAKHVGAILDENKDLYMLNPCSGKIWFVVELCEPIQVQQVQLANLELFSSMPHLFDISISERFPAREWRLLGTFEARNERSVQTFVPKRDEVMFAKYMKFEMKSHFGNEHFCPLTLVRVLGVSMVEEYEESEEDKVVKQDETSLESEDVATADDATAKEANSAEILTEPATTETEKQESGSIGKMFNIVINAVDNLLGNGKSAPNNETSTNVSTNDKNTTQDESIDPDWESPITLVTNRSEVEGSPVSSSKPPLVTLLETGDGQDIASLPPLSSPLYSLKFLSRISPKNFGTNFCWFLEFMYRVSILSCVVQPYGNQTSAFRAFPLVDKKKTKPELFESSTQPLETEDFKRQTIAEQNIAVVDKKQIEDDVEIAATISQIDPILHDKETPNSTKLAEVEDETDETQRQSPPGADTEDLEQEETKKVDLKQVTAPDSVEVASHEQNKIEEVFVGDSVPDKPVCQSNNGNEDNSNELSGEETPKEDSDANVKVQNNLSEEQEAGNDIQVEHNDNIEKQNVSDEESTRSTPQISTEVSNEIREEVFKENIDPLPTEPALVSQSSDTKPSEPTASTSNEDAPSVPEVTTAIPPVAEDDGSKTESTDQDKEQIVINPGTNQKESVLMRLSNRIRTLEQNLSLSSTYLENLSQRYKKKMDEMQRAFVEAQNRLSETSRTAEENNIKHSEAIAAEKAKSEELQKKIQDMTESLEYLNRCMIARHLCLMVIESIILIVICVTYFGIRQIRLTRRLELAEKQIEFLLAHQTDLSNGHFKAASVTRKQQISKSRSNAAFNGKAGQDHKIHPSKSSRSLQALDINTTNIVKPVPLVHTSTSSTTQRKKPIKAPSSPLLKRKARYQGKVQKSSAKFSNGSLSAVSSLTSSWPPDLVKDRKSSKPKKNCSKSELRMQNGIKENGSAYSHYTDKLISASACASSAFPWQVKFFTNVSGKAR